MKGWKVDIQARLATHTETGLRFRFSPDPAHPGEWDGQCIDMELAAQLVDLDAPDIAQQLARFSRESAEAFAAKIIKAGHPLSIRYDFWERSVLDDAAKKANIDRAAYIRTRSLDAAKKELLG